MVIISVCACYAKPRLKELESKYIKTIVENDVKRFDTIVWKNSGPKDRGEMLYDLFMSNAFIGKPGNDVVEILGRNTSSFMSKNQPCYLITYDGEKYYLGFTMKYTSTKSFVRSVGLYKNRKELGRSSEWFWKKMDVVKKYAIKYKKFIVKNSVKYKNIIAKNIITYKNKTVAYIKSKFSNNKSK